VLQSSTKTVALAVLKGHVTQKSSNPIFWSKSIKDAYMNMSVKFFRTASWNGQVTRFQTWENGQALILRFSRWFIGVT